jgi:hypothetical protein
MAPCWNGHGNKQPRTASKLHQSNTTCSTRMLVQRGECFVLKTTTTSAMHFIQFGRQLQTYSGAEGGQQGRTALHTS